MAQLGADEVEAPQERLEPFSRPSVGPSLPGSVDRAAVIPASASQASLGPAANLEASLLARIRGHKSLAVHADKAKRWIIEGKLVKIVFSSEFEIVLIQQEIKALQDCIHSILGPDSSVTLLVEEDRPKDDPISTEFDRKVELFRKVFRGDVID